MSFIQLAGLNDIHEKPPAPEGEYDLQVLKYKGYTKEDTGNYVISVTIGFENESKYANFKHYLSMPGPKDDEEATLNKMLQIKRSLKLFGVDFNSEGFQEEELAGCRFRCQVGQEEDQNGIMRNRLQVPFLK